MVTNIIQKPHKSFENGNEKSFSRDNGVDQSSKSPSTIGSAEISDLSKLGHLELNGSETNYLGATHWATILDDVSIS